MHRGNWLARIRPARQPHAGHLAGSLASSRRTLRSPRPGPPTTPTRACEVTRYVIRVIGHLDPQWSEWFDGLVITALRSGNTVLAGDIVDQAALHGTLNKIRDLNLLLISVTAAGPGSQSHLPNGI